MSRTLDDRAIQPSALHRPRPPARRRQRSARRSMRRSMSGAGAAAALLGGLVTMMAMMAMSGGCQQAASRYWAQRGPVLDPLPRSATMVHLGAVRPAARAGRAGDPLADVDGETTAGY